MTFLRIVIPL